MNNKCDKSIQNSKIKEDTVDTIFFIPYIRIVLTSFKVKNYFSLKCHTPLPLLANVVYKLNLLNLFIKFINVCAMQITFILVKQSDI